MLFLRELTRDLKPHDTDPGGLFRVYYALRNPRQGRGFGLDGVEDLALIERYVQALERARQLFHDEWNWPCPRPGSDGRVPVYVMRTAKIGEGDFPLTLTGEVQPGVFESKLLLRSSFDEPRPAVRDELARVEAAHEASHAFTHQFVPRAGYIGDIWAWFDEATAVFVEGACFPEIPESRRFGAYWSRCPEYSLVTWRDYDFPAGGYFAAWFVRYLVNRFGPSLLLEVWKWGAASPEARDPRIRVRRGPIAAIAERLAARHTRLEDVFWDYCRSAYVADEALAPGVAESYGPRSLTESFMAPDGPGRDEPLLPMACRYYRIQWPEEADREPVTVRVGTTAGPDAVRVALLTIGPDGRLLREAPVTAGEPTSPFWTGTAEPPPPGGHVAVVVARVEAVPDEYPATLTPILVHVSIGPGGPAEPAAEPEFAWSRGGVSARQASFYGPRSAVARPREPNPESADDRGAVAGRSTPGRYPSPPGPSPDEELPPDYRRQLAEEYRRRQSGHGD